MFQLPKVLNLFHCRFAQKTIVLCANMNLHAVVAVLNEFAPTKYAANWDNVGLLVEPTAPHEVKRIMLTNDLTPFVLEECVSNKVNMVISYHPPIFKAFKQLTSRAWKERLIVGAIENRIAVFSPHTSWDAINGGVNDWLAKCFGDLESCTPIQCNHVKTMQSVCIDVDMSELSNSTFAKELIAMFPRTTSQTVGNFTRFSVSCSRVDVFKLTELGVRFGQNIEKWQATSPANLLIPSVGSGRLCRLTSPASISELLERVKSFLSLDHLRLALGDHRSMDSVIKSVALCAGSGSSVLRGVKADLYLTGEMSHHDVLDATCAGTTVVLCEHSNTERGFLKDVKDTLLPKLNGADILISNQDHDPLKVY